MTEKYAPEQDNNDPKAYAKELLSLTGVSPTTTFGNMTDEEIEKIAYTMRVKEGFYRTNIPYTEEWLETTNISVSDGNRSIANYPFKVTLGDKTYDWITNKVGKLPAIFHIVDGMTIEIKENNLTGKENTVYKATAGEQTKNILLKKALPILQHILYLNNLVHPKKKINLSQLSTLSSRMINLLIILL